MTNHEALQVTMKITEFRMSPQYQAAEALRRKSGAQALAAADPNSNEHAALWLLVGTWDRIAVFVQDFNPGQRRKFFRCTPVSLAWQALYPGVAHIRSGGAHPTFARRFEELATEYTAWTQSDDGQEFRTAAQQTVCALFA